MRRGPSTIATLGLGLGLLAAGLACTPEPEEEGEDCFMYQPPEDSSSWPTRSLEIGQLEDGVFTPWVEGGVRTVELGFQGAYMLTPSFAVAREDSDEARSCWFVRVDAGDPERPLEPLSGVYPGGFVFGSAGDEMRAGPLFHVVDESLFGVEQRMDVTVYGPDFSASASVSYRIEP